MSLKIYNSGECEVIIRDNILNQNGDMQDIIYCTEVQTNDVYGVRELKKYGFLPQTIVDIGGNIGTFSMMANKYWPNASIYTFEPDRPCFNILQRNCPNANCFNDAVIGFLREPEKHNTHKCIYHSSDPEEPYRNNTRKNSISSLDIFYHMYHVSRPINPKIDFLKIDCEECEINIFRELDENDYIRCIDRISGEWHGRHCREELIETLSKTHICDFEDRPKGGIFKCRLK